jgi:hyaluronoglucosaminidase
MTKTGVIEGFFGPKWPREARLSYAPFLARYGGDFYIYAPKQDPHLRKQWRDPWDESYRRTLDDLRRTFQASGVRFGVGFSPFGLGSEISAADRTALMEKLSALQDLGVDLLGLFFDDMPVTPNLARTQIDAVNFVRQSFRGQIVFCPSYYTPDPILDKVFGPRPPGYLEELAEGIPSAVAIAWAGPKVISPDIDVSHLRETAALLKRSPFLWENLYANDGPKNCKFLKLRPFTGRSADGFRHTEAIGLNLMNQPELSKILFLSSQLVIAGKEVDAEAALRRAIGELASPEFGDFLLRNRDTFFIRGLDALRPAETERFLRELASFPDPAAREVADWLNGSYTVGPECLTD